MESILIACGDTDTLRDIVAALPQDEFKPIATRKGGGIAEKLKGRGLRVAIIHESLQDGPGAVLANALKQLDPVPKILYLVPADIPKDGPFDLALKFPVPGPVLRNGLKRITAQDASEQDMARWKAFYEEIKARLELVPTQSYYQMLGLKAGAPHHVIVSVYDAISLRYHPDRYSRFRSEKWGAAIHEHVNELYKTYTEAYGVLSDRKSRAKYDEALSRGELRLSDDAALDSGPRTLGELSQNAAAKKFLKLAQSDVARRDWAQAIQNLRFALSLEPDNQAVQAKIAEYENLVGK